MIRFRQPGATRQPAARIGLPERRSFAPPPTARETEEGPATSGGHDFSRIAVFGAPIQLCKKCGYDGCEHDEFVPDPEAMAAEEEEDLRDERRYGPRTNQRQEFWGSGFIDNQQFSITQTLMDRQQFQETAPGQASMISPLSGEPFDLRRHKERWVEDREFEGDPHQPVKDHEVDVLALEDQWDEASLSEMSSAEETTFKDYVYNFPENLRILPKSEDKDSSLNPTYRMDTLPRKLKRKAREVIKNARKSYKRDKEPYWKRKRDKRRRKKGYTSLKGITKPRPRRPHDDDRDGSGQGLTVF